MDAIIRLDPIHQEILKITMEKAVAVLQPGTTPTRDGDCTTTWRHSSSDMMVEIVNQGGIKVYVTPTDAPDRGVLIATGRRLLTDAVVGDESAVLEHLLWMQSVVVAAEPVDGTLWNHNKALADAIAGVCALHPDAKRASNVHLYAKSHDRDWSLSALSNVEKVELLPELVAWVHDNTRSAETINDYYGEDYMFAVSVWHGYPTSMSEDQARLAVAILPEHLRDGVVSVTKR